MGGTYVFRVLYTLGSGICGFRIFMYPGIAGSDVYVPLDRGIYGFPWIRDLLVPP